MVLRATRAGATNDSNRRRSRYSCTREPRWRELRRRGDARPGRRRKTSARLHQHARAWTSSVACTLFPARWHARSTAVVQCLLCSHATRAALSSLGRYDVFRVNDVRHELSMQPPLPSQHKRFGGIGMGGGGGGLALGSMQGGGGRGGGMAPPRKPSRLAPLGQEGRLPPVGSLPPLGGVSAGGSPAAGGPGMGGLSRKPPPPPPGLSALGAVR